jgi:tripartite-type tricarboxylate transporter receptor subunit TctC
MTIARSLLRALAAVALAGAVAPAHAQAWPDRPLRFIVAAGPGSSLDALARVIGEKLKDRLGQPIIVENKPTVAEAGYPDFEALDWNGVLVPAVTPKAGIAKLYAEINAILKQPDVVAKMHASGFDLIGGTPEDFGNLIRRETDAWAPVIRKLGVKID